MFVDSAQFSSWINCTIVAVLWNWLLLPPSDCAPTFTQPTKVPPAYEDVYVQEGSDARLVWTYSVTNRNELDRDQAVRWSTFIPQLTKYIADRKVIINEKRDEIRQIVGAAPYLTGRVSIENPATLVIDNVKTTDDNFYECLLTPSALSPPVRSLIRLTVIKPPVIATPSINSSYNEGTKVDITCNATGKPTPTVTWFRVGNSKVYSTGEASAALSFSSVNRSDDGQYKCKANNTAGTRETGELPLVVHYKPDIVTGESNSTVGSWDNNDLTLQCVARGVPAATFQWFKPGSEMIDSNANPVKGGSSVTVRTSAPGDYGQYKCRANNVVGSRDHIITVNQWHKPGKPKITLKEAYIEASYIKLTWTSPVENGGSPVIDYRVIVTGAADQTLEGVIGMEALIDKLTPGKSYTVILSSRHIVGYGESDSKPFTTKSKGKPGIPMLQNTETAVSLEKIKLTWSAAAENGGKILTYTVRWREVASSGGVGDWIKQNTSSDDLTYTVTGLEFGKTYDFGVTAWNKYGESGLDVKNVKRIKVVPTPGTKPTAPAPTVTVKQEQTSCTKDSVYGSFIAILVLFNVLQLLYIIWMRRKIKVLEEEKRSPMVTGDNKDLHENPAASPTSTTVCEYMTLAPMTRNWEVSRDKVNIVKIIGKGAFGQVAKATVDDLRNVKGNGLVAVKMLKDNARNTDRKDLLSELELMKRLKPHPHVIKLLGCVTETEPIMVVIEYVPYGDLLGYLRKSRGLNDTYYKDPDAKPRTNLTSQQLIKFAWQVADGMEYLSNKKIIHRDLAARNVLVGEGETCKVTDFGMARDVQQEDIYTKTSKGRLPVKWTSYEALMFGKYTTQSDVWSYGVMLYEVFTIGGCPYPRLKGQEIAQMLQDGYIMSKPQHVDQRLYQLMLDCWQENPDARPTFSSLRNTLKGMERNHVTYVNLKEYNSKLYANLEDLHGEQ